jgi:uncharacterized protein (TIGR02145 family)
MFKLGFFPHGGGTPPAPTYVQIGTQKWNLKNLDVTTYRDGTPIPYAANSSQWSSYSSSGIGCYASVNFNSANDAEYGLLYNGYAIQNVANLAPEGWHIPTYEEINTLTAYLGGYSTAGGTMKETGTTHWNSPNTGATNSSGFTSVGAGYINTSNNYVDFKATNRLAIYGDLGLSVYYYMTRAGFSSLYLSWTNVTSGALEEGYSVRLIRNDSLALGDNYGSGIIFQIEGDPLLTGSYAYIVLNDLAYSDSYGCSGIDITANSDGDFVTNTNNMDINSCNTLATFIRTPNNIGGFSDWYLAAKNQAQIILDDNRVTGISVLDTYWSSTEVSITDAKALVYSVGTATWDNVPRPKVNSYPFFLIRAQAL